MGDHGRVRDTDPYDLLSCLKYAPSRYGSSLKGYEHPAPQEATAPTNALRVHAS